MVGINDRPWMVALETQLKALALSSRLAKSQHPRLKEIHSSWMVDVSLLTRAAPFAWSAEVIDAVSLASKSIPLDTKINEWNLSTSSAWWHFEKPLPFQTATVGVNSGVMHWEGVRALAFGWLPTEDRSVGMPCCVWIDAKDPQDTVSPSQTWEWKRDQTLGQMLEETRMQHRSLYGPTGRWRNRPIIGEDKYIEAAEGISRFVLAGLAWINQKILVPSDGFVERHRRKEFKKLTKHDVSNVKVVQLRKSQYVRKEVTGETKTVDWSCRWVVTGHWKNVACGPKRGEHRLVYILPYPKGPDGLPFKEPKTAIYEVNR